MGVHACDAERLHAVRRTEHRAEADGAHAQAVAAPRVAELVVGEFAFDDRQAFDLGRVGAGRTVLVRVGIRRRLAFGRRADIEVAAHPGGDAGVRTGR